MIRLTKILKLYPVFLKQINVRNMSAKSNTFPYLFESKELVEKLKYSKKKDLILSSEKLYIDNIHNLITPKNFKCMDDINLFTNTVILATKFGQSLDTIEKSFCESFIIYMDNHVRDMTADEAISTLVALNLLNVPLCHPVNQNLCIRIANLLKG